MCIANFLSWKGYWMQNQNTHKSNTPNNKHLNCSVWLLSNIFNVKHNSPNASYIVLQPFQSQLTHTRPEGQNTSVCTHTLYIIYIPTWFVIIHVILIIIILFTACSCSRYNVLSDWLIVGHYSLVMPVGWLWACKNKAKSHMINNLLTSNARFLWENLKTQPSHIELTLS